MVTTFTQSLIAFWTFSSVYFLTVTYLHLMTIQNQNVLTVVCFNQTAVPNWIIDLHYMTYWHLSGGCCYQTEIFVSKKMKGQQGFHQITVQLLFTDFKINKTMTKIKLVPSLAFLFFISFTDCQMVQKKYEMTAVSTNDGYSMDSKVTNTITVR